MDDVRRKAQAIIDRAKADPTFVQQVKATPEVALVEAGLAERAVHDFMAEQGYQPEVVGYAYCSTSCVDLTCIISACPASCTFWTRTECLFTYAQP
jgi:hypothetical protein